MQHQFETYFNTLSTIDLIDIILNEKDVAEEALIAAKAELQKRNISEELIDNERKKRLISKQKSELLGQKIEELKKEARNEVEKLIKPDENPSDKKIIKGITLGFIILFSLKTYDKWTNFSFDYHAATKFILFLPSIWLLLLIIPFFKIKKLGWLLAAGFLSFEITSILIENIEYWYRYFAPEFFSYIFVLSSSLILLLKKKFILLFNVSDKEMTFTLIFGFFGGIFYHIIMYSFHHY